MMDSNLKPYEYPIGHPCRGCPYILETTKPSCMFPKNGELCFMEKQQGNMISTMHNKDIEAEERITEFIKVLESVKKRKGYK